MKTYKKRIAFLISSQHFILHGGIGTFARAFLDMCNEMNYKVDFILDKEPVSVKTLKNSPEIKDLKSFIGNNGGRIKKAPISYSYKEHSDRFVFKDTVNLEKNLNFRDALLQSFSDSIYDLILINSNDAIFSTLITGLQSYIPTVVYSHSGELVFDQADPVFKDTTIDLYRNLMEMNSIIIGTHSNHNKSIINKRFPKMDVMTLPLRIADKGLLEPQENIEEKNGVLFVGRFEPRKDPQTFLDAASKAGLKILILTNEKGAKKFTEKLLKLGYEKDEGKKNQNNGKVFEIKHDIYGEKKEEFMKKAKLSFQPAVLESYAYSTVEALHCCRTVLLKEYDWTKNFEGLAEFTDKKNMVEDLKKWHEEDYDFNKHLNKMQKIFDDAPDLWNKIFEKTSIEKLNKSKNENKLVKALRKAKPDFYTIEAIITDFLRRDISSVAADDTIMIYNAVAFLDFVHTNNETYVKLKEWDIDFKKSESGSDLIF